jgi:metal-responsive CopG/Arc/MetJ family transcriptional regulator
MKPLSRAGVSIDQDLLEQFDPLIAQRGYKNRSEALRDLMRESLVSEASDSNKVVVATLTMVYDHHPPKSLAEAHGDAAPRARQGARCHARPSGRRLLSGGHHHEGA